MALIICPECGKQVSDQVKICIQCGYPIRKWLKETKKHENELKSEIQQNEEDDKRSGQFGKETLAENSDSDVLHSNKEKKPINKIPIAVMAVVIVMGIFGILTYTHIICLNHEYLEATCVEPGKCKYCGKTHGKALGHKWKDATCIKPMYCTVCDETKGDALGHNWKEATCTTPKICTVCKLESGAEKGHVDGSWETVIKATLLKDGKEQKKCKICNKVIDTKTITKLPKYVYDAYNFGAEEFVDYLNAVLSKSAVLDWDQATKLDNDGKDSYDVPLYQENQFTGVTLALNEDDYGYVMSFLIVGKDKATVCALGMIIGETVDSTVNTDNVNVALAYGIYEYTSGSTDFLYMEDDDLYCLGIIHTK